MSQPVKISITPTSETRMGRMLAAGRLTATIKSKRTGTHITVSFTSKVKTGQHKWSNERFAQATHVFINGGQGNKLGTFYPQKGNLYLDTQDAAWIYSIMAILNAAQSGVQDTDQFEISESDHCGKCGKELTDPVSIARGIGPTCLGAETGSEHYKADPANKVEAAEKTQREMWDRVYGPVKAAQQDAQAEANREMQAEGQVIAEEEAQVDRKGRALPKTFAELAARVA